MSKPRWRMGSDLGSSSSSSSPELVVDDDAVYSPIARSDSQSSLGANSIRDMNMSRSLEREHRLSPISRLPPELLCSIFGILKDSISDLRNCALVSKRWSENCIEILWQRPSCNTWKNLLSVVAAVQNPLSYYAYNHLVKRINLSNLGDQVSNGSVRPFIHCKRIERLTLTGCIKLTDRGVTSLVEGSKCLLALDITGLDSVTDHTLLTVATHCPRLQGLNITDCSKITDESLVAVAHACRYLKRLKLNNCSLLTDESILAVAHKCLSMLEIDLYSCKQVSDAGITALLSKGRSLRELRIGHCILITDNAFLDLPKHLTFESLRILDLTACARLRDEAVEKIIDTSPRLRNLVLAKCREITDRSVLAITKLGKNLHYIHLGHCAHISDAAVMQLVKSCNRIRYIDLACCSRLTDLSVTQLATLPKLRRIGLVKCGAITDSSIFALAKSSSELRMRPQGPSQLERVHLSYCQHLTLGGIYALLNHCPKLTHLSLTGVSAFFTRSDLKEFCRDAPQEFTDHQRNVFCVFSGEGVNRLRDFLNEDHTSSCPAEETMFDDRDGEDTDADQALAGLIQATGLGPDDEDMEDEPDPGDGSQDGGET